METNQQKTTMKKANQFTRKEITLEQYHEQLKAQGVDIKKALMRCPACGTVQCWEDFKKAGVHPPEIESYLGFSCIGRFTKAGDEGIKKHNQGKRWNKGCNWTLGGLFQIHTLVVVAEDGTKHPRFEVLTKEDAEEFRKTHLTTASC